MSRVLASSSERFHHKYTEVVYCLPWVIRETWYASYWPVLNLADSTQFCLVTMATSELQFCTLIQRITFIITYGELTSGECFPTFGKTYLLQTQFGLSEPPKYYVQYTYWNKNSTVDCIWPKEALSSKLLFHLSEGKNKSLLILEHCKT